MKKITLLLLTVCNSFVFAQTNRATDVTLPKVVKTPIVYKYPTKPTVTLDDYYKEFAQQNMIAPKLYEQVPYSTANITSQQFEAANTTFNSMAADDFVVPATKIWNVSTVFVRGYSTSASYPTSYNVQFYTNSAGNVPDSIIRSENVVLAAGSINPTLTLATPLTLSAGKYWVSVQAVLDYTGGGQWYWETYDDPATLSAPFAWTNPGGGFGTTCSAVWNTASVCLPGQLKDLQFSLDGIEASICKTITGRVISTDPTHTPRITRDGVASACGVAKVYPGDFGSSNYHYKSYTVQNTSATPDCVTLTLQNTDLPTALHLVAYTGSFNPANISQNYLGDTGFSSLNGSTVNMSVTIPGNTTIVLVVTEPDANTTYASDFILNVLSANCGSILRTVDNSLNNISIYPNPVHKVLFVNGMKVNEAKVYDVSGKLVPVKTSENQINVEPLTNGNYLLQVKDKSGKVHHDKFIKN